MQLKPRTIPSIISHRVCGKNSCRSRPPSPFRLMLLLFGGFAMSLVYCGFAVTIVWYFDGQHEAQRFFASYTTSFRTILSLGVILGTALVVHCSQHVIPETIEAAFQGKLTSDYYYYKGRFWSPQITAFFCGEMIIWSFAVFANCEFPLFDLGQDLMLAAVCAEFALAAYVGRKLMYTGMMLHSLLPITVKRNLFRKRELDAINPYVHVASTLTIIWVYVHVTGYYAGPFKYSSWFGETIRLFLLLPAILAVPVLLIFNFYPRAVLRKLYSQSIDFEIKRLKAALRSVKLSAYEKRSYLIELDKMSRDELRYSLQLALSDLPIGITIVVMVLQTVLGK